MRLLTIVGMFYLIACESDKSITIQNPAPKADIISHDDGTNVLEGFSTTFVGSVTDSNHTPDQLITIWYVNGEVVCDDVIPDTNGQTECAMTLGMNDTEISLAVLDSENSRAEDSIEVSIVESESPVVTLVSPTVDGVYYSNQLISFEGVLADAEDSPDLLEGYWSSNIQGVLNEVETVPNNSGEVIGFGNLSEGQHAIQLIVTDTTGKQSQESVVINVGPPNSPPICEITTPSSGAVGSEGETVEFTATTSDVDVNPDWLTVTWSSDKDGNIGTSIPTSEGVISFSFADLSVNTHTVTMRVADELGETCTKAVVYTVGTPPSVVVNAPLDGSVVNEGTPIEFNSSVSDEQDQVSDIELEWVLNGSVLSTQRATSSGTSMFTDNSLSYGSYNLVVTATDTDGLTDSDQVSFSINGQPSAPVVSINPSSPISGDNLAVSLDVPSIDPEGVQVTYAYEWRLGGQVQPSFTTSILPNTATVKGEQWTVHVLPSDGHTVGIAGVASVTIANTAPTMTGVNITPNVSVYNDSVLTCLGAATDPDETPVITYEWLLNGIIVGTGSTLDVSSTGVEPTQSILCTSTATDSDGATDANSATVTIDNRTPLITTTISTNGTNNTGELTCLGTATDLDGEIPSVTYEWFASGISLGTSNPLLLDPSMGTAGDVIDCVATATDGFGGIDTDSASHIITNSSPIIDSISMSPTVLNANTFYVGCSATSSDTDGDSVTYSYAWFVDGVLDPSATGNVFLQSWVVGSEVTCRMTPNDGSVDGSFVEASSIVENTPPTVSSVSLSPTMAYTNDTITASAVLNDVDGTQAGALTANYNWYVEGISVQSGSGNTLNGLDYFNRDQNVYVVVTPNDGMEDGLSMTSNGLLISNSAPSLSSVVVTPTVASVGVDDLYCDAIATDLDGDSVLYTYVWSDSSGTQQSTIEVTDTSDVFLAGGLTEDTWSCEVTPYDSTDYGLSLSDDVSVEVGCASLVFDGSGDGVLVGESQNLLGVTTDFSIGGWVWLTDPVTAPSLPIFTAESTNSSNANNTGGYALRIINGSLAIMVGTGTTGTDSYPNPNWYAAGSLPTEEWVHVAGTREGATVRLYVNGSLVLEDLNGSTDPIEYVSGGYNHSKYYIGRSFPNGLSSNTQFSMDGRLSNVGVWDRALTATEVASLSSALFDATIGGLVGHWAMDEASGSITMDSTASGNTGIFEGDVVWDMSCPIEDVDGDGVAAFIDCDDTDPSITNEGNGSSSGCAAESCKRILDDGYAQVGDDGLYWIDPDSMGPLEVYCDMTIDGGGWSVYVQNLGYPTTNIQSVADYQDFCSDIGLSLAGREVENPVSWLVQKNMLWNTNHALKQNGWPDAWVVSNQYGGSLAMPMFRTSQGLVSVYDQTIVTLPPNRIGDHCDPGGSEDFCGYWHNSGWSDSDLTVYPDSEDWGSIHNHAEMYISCLFR